MLLVALILKTEALERLALSCTEGHRVTKMVINRHEADKPGGLALTVHCDRCEQNGVVFETIKNKWNSVVISVGNLQR